MVMSNVRLQIAWWLIAWLLFSVFFFFINKLYIYICGVCFKCMLWRTVRPFAMCLFIFLYAVNGSALNTNAEAFYPSSSGVVGPTTLAPIMNQNANFVPGTSHYQTHMLQANQQHTPTNQQPAVAHVTTNQTCANSNQELIAGKEWFFFKHAFDIVIFHNLTLLTKLLPF